MSTAAIPANNLVAHSPNKFVSIMQHILKYATIGLVDLIKYAPKVDALVGAMFPAIKLESDVVTAGVVEVGTLIQNTVLLVQAKYKDATASTETNAQKLADVMLIVEKPALTLLSKVGVNYDADRIKNAVNIAVATLNNSAAPASA